MAYTNSSLVSYTKLSPNHSGQRTHSIDRITPHCVVGQLSAESICGCFTSPSRQASCNYGIGTDGRISLCVEEKNRSWCSSSNANDQRAITIECASDISPNEAQFLETRKFQIDEIARIFRVPPHMVGDLEKSSFSNIEQQSLEYVKYTLEPWIVRWEQALNRALLSDSEKAAYFVKFNVDGLLRGDYQSRMNGYATARQNGWMSANDIRELENLDRIPAELGGDLYLINGNMTKLEDAGIFAAASAAGKEDDSNEEILELEKSDTDES